MTPGGLVMVGGHSRGVGKTLLIERWLRARPHEAWTAVKVSAHRHAPHDTAAALVEEAVGASTDTETGRYLAAGAKRAFFVRAPDAALHTAATFIAALLERGARVIVESNRLVRVLKPDVLFFVVDPDVDDWKTSSADCLSVPEVILCRHHGRSRHGSYITPVTVGDGAALRSDSLHRVALPCEAAPRSAGLDRAGRAGRT